MKWTFIIEQKLKIALCLFAFATAILITTLLERRNMGDMNKSFSSIYHDRLVPATDIFYLSENLYNKRFTMEQILFKGNNNDYTNLKSHFVQNNRIIDSLIAEFEKTYLVSDESKYLASFKSKVRDYTMIENSVIDLLENGYYEKGNELYRSQGKSKMQQSIMMLYKLTSIQSSEGKSLIDNTKKNLMVSDILTHLNIGLIIVVLLIIQIFVFSSKPLPFKKQKFNLN